MALDFALSTDGAELRSDSGQTFPLGRLARIGQPGHDPRLFLLEEIWSEGNASQVAPGHWRVAWAQALVLDPADAQALGVPSPESTTASLRSEGIPTSSSFRIIAEVRHPVHGALDLSRREGPAVRITGGEFVLLDKPTWEMLRVVDEAPRETASQEDRLEYLARCKSAASAAGASIDGFLESQEIVLEDGVGVEIGEDGDEITLTPSASGAPGQRVVLPSGKSRKVLHGRTGDGRTRRVVLTHKARKQAEHVYSHTRLRDEQVPEFLTNPEAFLPEDLELSDFSERVVGFTTRVYNSRPYIHVTRKSGGWLEFDAGIQIEDTGATGQPPGVAGSDISLSEEQYNDLVRQAAEKNQRWVKHDGSWIEVDPELGQQFLEATEKIRQSADEDGRLWGKLGLDVIPNLEELGFEIRLPEGLTPDRPWLEELPSILPPDAFHGELAPHQLTGFRWLRYLKNKGGGGLLADEMGVGKTAQVIAHLAALQEVDELKPSLLVVPKTLIQNWMQELQRFAPGVAAKSLVHTGANRATKPGFLERVDLVITTYETVRHDQLVLGLVNWNLIVADEAQFVKNPTAGRTSALKGLKSRQPIALTGTPVENGLIEFWCIVDFVQPGLLGSWSDFRQSFERPLADAAENERPAIVENLLSALDPHYLRRKKDVALKDLPPKIVVPDLNVELSSSQSQLYVAVLDSAREAGRGAVLAAIGRLLRLCAHPRIETGDWDAVSGDTLIAECPKLALTLDVLDAVRTSGEKALVFSEWKAAQRVLQRAIHERFGIWSDVINGDVTNRRQDLIDRFERTEGFNVLVLGPQVAGFGLNIVSANHVIHYTRPWNPAKEDQATDRVHRRGQTRPVHVYYPTVKGTVEDRLAELLAEKAALAHDVLRPSAERTVSSEDLLSALVAPHGTNASRPN